MSDASQHRSEGSGQEGREGADSGRSKPEWVTLGISLAIILGVVGLLTWLYLGASDPERAMLTAEPQLAEIWEVNTVFYLPVQVENHGQTAAENVVVEVVLEDDTGRQTVEFTLEILAGGVRQTGVAVFPRDPRDGEVTAGITSFVTP